MVYAPKYSGVLAGTQDHPSDSFRYWGLLTGQASYPARLARLTCKHVDIENAIAYWLAGIGLSAAVPTWLGTTGVIG